MADFNFFTENILNYLQGISENIIWNIIIIV